MPASGGRLTGTSATTKSHSNWFVGSLASSARWWISAGCLAAFVDLDHFAAAGSLRIEDAIAIGSRPPLHSSALAVAIVVILAALSGPRSRLTGVVAVSLATHHLRDVSSPHTCCLHVGSDHIPLNSSVKDDGVSLFREVCLFTVRMYFNIVL